MTAFCVSNVQILRLCLAPFQGLGQNTRHAIRGSHLNSGSLFCCRVSELSACSLSGDVAQLEPRSTQGILVAGLTLGCEKETRHHPTENKPQLPSGFKCGVSITDCREVTRPLTSFPVRSEGVVKFHPTERNGLGRNDGLQNRSCNAVKNVQLNARLIELKERSPGNQTCLTFGKLYQRKAGY